MFYAINKNKKSQSTFFKDKFVIKLSDLSKEEQKDFRDNFKKLG